MGENNNHEGFEFDKACSKCGESPQMTMVWTDKPTFGAKCGCQVAVLIRSSFFGSMGNQLAVYHENDGEWVQGFPGEWQ